jgi:hypothetical protein
MEHGYALRGDSNVTAVANASETAYQAGVDFLKKHLV